MENYSNYTADYGCDIANSIYTKCMDDSWVTHKGYGGMRK